MMRFIILLSAILFLFPTPTYAQNDPGSTGGTNPTNSSGSDGAKCGWEGFKNASGEKESTNNYGATNGANYLGRFQFGEGALNSIGLYFDDNYACGQCNGGKMCEAGMRNVNGVQLCYNDFGGPPGFNMPDYSSKGCKKKIETDKDFLACEAAQDETFDKWMNHLYKSTKKCHNRVGQSACGCTVTISGILAAAHLGGPGGGCKAANGGSRNDGGDSTCKRLCEFADYEVPSEITGGAPVASSGNCKGCQKVCTPSNTPTPNGSSGSTSTGAGSMSTESLTSSEVRFNSLSETLKAIWVGAFQLMTSQLSTVMMQQMEVIGTFFDAKHQLETQRLIQQKTAQAHKDYHPSLQMCEIGTFARDLANSDIRSELSKTALSRSMIDRALGTGDVKTVQGALSDVRSRRKSYIDKFCNIKDNANQNKLLCKKSGKAEQQNADINFTQTIDAPLTLNINLLEGDEESMEKENIFAFLDYIFMHNSFPFISKNSTEYSSFVEPYQEMRSLIAMRSVAQNSFANIIAQKTAGPEKEGESAAPFLKALMREIGLEDAEIEETLGKNPSYYAQMEILTKKIYQHPEFISNLYDKPANVKRIRAALSAIKLMQDRDIHDSMLRREMLVSMILELRLRQKQAVLTNDLEFIISNPPGTPLPTKGGKGPKPGKAIK